MPARSPEKSAEVKRIIREMYMLGTKTTGAMAESLNGDEDFVRRYGKISKDGIYYHLRTIRRELSEMVSEDALETYIPEFIRTRNSMEDDIDEANKMLDTLPLDECKKNPKLMEIRMRLVNMIHNFRLDQFKQLQDIELPITISAVNHERNSRRLKPVEEVEIINERVSESGNTQNSS